MTVMWDIFHEAIFPIIGYCRILQHMLAGSVLRTDRPYN